MTPDAEIEASFNMRIRVRPPSGIGDAANLIHRIGAERIELGLHQVARRVSIG